ncbi:MAG: response regulator [Candidatus Bathyarchaeota archaeon]|nr:response regulator [Candidatus Bathyarchaeota archaeon]
MSGNARILVVDDDESIRTVFKINLEERGYFVETAETGEEALAKTKAEFYNLALIDIRLPDMEGTELLTAIGKSVPEMVKLIVTGFPTLQNAVEAVNMGADGYVLKPVDMDGLMSLIKELLERQREEKRYSEEKVSEFIETRARELRSLSKSGLHP